MNNTLKEAVETATTVADILALMDRVIADEVTIHPIAYCNGVPRWDTHYMADGATLSIEWVDIEPDGPELVDSAYVRNPLYNQGVTDEMSATMILDAYRMKKPKQTRAASPAEPEPDDEDIPFPF